MYICICIHGYIYIYIITTTTTNMLLILDLTIFKRLPELSYCAGRIHLQLCTIHTCPDASSVYTDIVLLQSYLPYTLTLTTPYSQLASISLITTTTHLNRLLSPVQSILWWGIKQNPQRRLVVCLTWLIFCLISIADIMHCLILTVWCFQSVVKVKGAVG